MLHWNPNALKVFIEKKTQNGIFITSHTLTLNYTLKSNNITEYNNMYIVYCILYDNILYDNCMIIITILRVILIETWCYI